MQSVIGDLDIEGEFEREDAEDRIGGGIGFGVPLFNLGAGKREAAVARLKVLVERRAAQEATLRANARAAAARLTAAREAAVIGRTRVLPLANQVLSGALLDLNAMEVGVFQVLAAKRGQLAAGQAYIASLRDYWVARTRFEQVLAGGSARATGVSMGPMGGAAAGDGAGDHS